MQYSAQGTSSFSQEIKLRHCLLADMQTDPLPGVEVY
jgi:hypothetical protein